MNIINTEDEGQNEINKFIKFINTLKEFNIKFKDIKEVKEVLLLLKSFSNKIEKEKEGEKDFSFNNPTKETKERDSCNNLTKEKSEEKKIFFSENDRNILSSNFNFEISNKICKDEISSNFKNFQMENTGGLLMSN